MSALRESRGGTASAEAPGLQRRMVAAGPIVAVVSMVAALIATGAAGIPLRDPDHVAGRRLVMLLALVGLLVALDVVVRASRRAQRVMPSRALVAEARRERWTWRRGGDRRHGARQLLRELLRLSQPQERRPAAAPERAVRPPAGRTGTGCCSAATTRPRYSNTLLGTGLANHALSGAYLLLFIFIPATLAAALVFSPNLQAGLFYASAQSLNWLLGAASYFLLPSLGPIYTDPGCLPANLPVTDASRQVLLLDQRIAFLHDPSVATAQSIAAFASLHVSIFVTGACRWSTPWASAGGGQIAAWALVALTTTSTIYLGWHDAVNYIGGALLAVMAIALARALTGFDARTPRRLRHDPARPRLMSVAHAQSAVRSVGRRAIAAGPAVAAVTVIVALVATGDVDVPLRDPDNVAATYFVLVGLGVALLVLLDVAIRAARAEGGGFPPSREAMGRVRRERWTAGRAVVAASALLGFYVTYMAYRNLKAVVPLVRPDALFDRQLADLDRALFGGHDPATVLHTLLGTGVSTRSCRPPTSRSSSSCR